MANRGRGIPNLSYIQTIPVFGSRLVETLKAMIKQTNNVATQVNGSPSGQETPPPPAVNALTVTAGGGIAHVQITDNNAIYRGISYHVQYSPDPGFSAPVTVPMGPSRDIRIPVGSQPLYYRAFSDYPTSAPSAPAYHGGATPKPVAAVGPNQPPIPAGQGSGTGYPSQISGHGPVPYRGNVAPRRA